jgi:hypothetical protein
MVHALQHPPRYQTSDSEFLSLRNAEGFRVGIETTPKLQGQSLETKKKLTEEDPAVWYKA